MEKIWEGNKDRNLEAEIEAEAIRSAVCWLAPSGLLGLLPCLTQDIMVWNGTTHSEPPISVTS